jgi:hypothetical protein
MSAAITGVDLLRQATRARALHGSLAQIARDLNVALSLLDEFTYSNGNLPPEALVALADLIFAGHTEYNPASGKLRPSNRRAAVPGPSAIPEPYRPKTLVDYSIRRPPMVPAQPSPAKTRPGWE